MSDIDHHVAHRPGPLNFLPDMLTRCKIDGVDGEEMERVVDQALKDRLTVLVEASRRGAVSQEQLEEMFSEKYRGLRLQLLVQGASAVDDCDSTVQKMQDAFQRQQEIDLLLDGRESGEWCPQAEAMSMVAGVQEAKLAGAESRWGAAVRAAHWEAGSEVRVMYESGELDGLVEEEQAEEEEDSWVWAGRLVAALTRSAARRAGEKEPQEEAAGSLPEVASRKATAPSHETRVREVTPLSSYRTGEGKTLNPDPPTNSDADPNLPSPDPNSTLTLSLPRNARSLALSGDGRELVEAFRKDSQSVLLAEQGADPFACAMARYLQTKEVSEEDAYTRNRVLKNEDSFAVGEDGLLRRLWYRDPRQKSKLEPVMQAYVPETLRGEVMASYHGGDRSGHLSPMKTWQRIRERFWWPGMSADVFAMVKACGVCQTRGRRPPK